MMRRAFFMERKDVLRKGRFSELLDLLFEDSQN
jgi:hypothetical protein